MRSRSGSRWRESGSAAKSRGEKRRAGTQGLSRVTTRNQWPVETLGRGLTIANGGVQRMNN